MENKLCSQLAGRESPAPESQTAEQQAPLCQGRICPSLRQEAQIRLQKASENDNISGLESNPVHPLEGPEMAKYQGDKLRRSSSC